MAGVDPTDRRTSVEQASVTCFFVAQLLVVIGVVAVSFFGLLLVPLAVVVWVTGVVLLVLSPRWDARRKLRGGLVLGAGLPAMLGLLLLVVVPSGTTTCTGSGSSEGLAQQSCETTGFVLPGWAGLLLAGLLGAYVVAQVLVARRMLRMPYLRTKEPDGGRVQLPGTTG